MDQALLSGTGPAEDPGPLHAVYEATYARTPGIAARRLQWAQEAHQRALDAGDQRQAAACTDQIRALTWLLAKHDRCQRCGRALKNKVSVDRGIGPECWDKTP